MNHNNSTHYNVGLGKHLVCWYWKSLSIWQNCAWQFFT